MDKKTQDLAWACLPKETRSMINDYYETEFNTSICADEVAGVLENLFGLHNLTSDAEPDCDVFIIPVEQVRETYAYNEQILKYDPDHKGAQMLQSYLLQTFGDKCLPDKESSVQVEPKFKVGDKVRKARWDKDTTISRVEWHGTWETFVYQFKEQEYGFNCHKENDLTLVSKRTKDPDFSIGDKVQLKFDWCRLHQGTLLTIKDLPTIDRDDTFMYSFEETDEYIRETMLEPYTEPETKDNMEEKELNNIVCVMWLDSYGVQAGWQDIGDYKANKLEITSVGKIIYEDDDVISLAHNFADESEHTLPQANGIMTIPKVCISKITSCSFSCQELESTPKQPLS